MGDMKKTLHELLPKLGAAGLDKAEGVLEGLSKSADKPWKRATLAMLADAIDKHGMEGIELAQTAIKRMMKGKKPDISWMDLETASDVLAHLQNAEVDEKSDAKDFLTQVGKSLGVLLSAVIKGLIAAA